MGRRGLSRETVYEMLAYYHSPEGIIASTCEKFGVTSQTLHRYKTRYYNGTLEAFMDKPHKNKEPIITGAMLRRDIEAFPDQSNEERAKRWWITPERLVELYEKFGIKHNVK